MASHQMKPLTFHQFQCELASRWVCLRYEFDQRDIDATATNQLWHTQNLIPFVEAGGELPMSICKSIVKHGWNSLDWFAKNYPECLGKYTDVRTGYAINKHDITKMKMTLKERIEAAHNAGWTHIRTERTYADGIPPGYPKPTPFTPHCYQELPTRREDYEEKP